MAHDSESHGCKIKKKNQLQPVPIKHPGQINTATGSQKYKQHRVNMWQSIYQITLQPRLSEPIKFSDQKGGGLTGLIINAIWLICRVMLP